MHELFTEWDTCLLRHLWLCTKILTKKIRIKKWVAINWTDYKVKRLWCHIGEPINPKAQSLKLWGGPHNTSYGRKIQSIQNPKLDNEAIPCIMFIGLMLCVNQFKHDNEAL